MDYPLYPIPGFAEPVSSLTHFLGVLLSIAMGVLLLKRGLLNKGRGELDRIASLLVFVGSCVFLFSMSGTYHLLEPGTTARAVLQRLDHAAIFMLIGGTMTPPHAILYRGWSRILVLTLIWGMAAVFITVKTIFFESVPEWLSLGGYLGMGWLGFFTGAHLWYKHGWDSIFPFLKWVYIGAIAYTVGAVLEFFRWPTLIYGVVGPHELFHIFVLFGAGAHGVFIYQLAGGIQLPSLEARRRARLNRLKRRAMLFAAKRMRRRSR